MKLQWNAGGWFGSQLGGTAWMLVAALLTTFQDLVTGLILLAVFAVPNAVGSVLWTRRKSTSCYAATQLLLFLIGVFGLLAVYVLEHRHLWESIQTGGTVSAGSAYVTVVAVVAILMVVFYFRFGRDSKGSDA